MKKKLNYINIFIGLTLIVIIVFLCYFISNIKPSKVQFKFENVVYEGDFINNSEIDLKDGKTAIYLNIDSEIFQEYNYHSYISGDGVGRKIYLKIYLINDDGNKCYEIKSHCYDYSDMDNLKFIGQYYTNAINGDEKYNIAVYIPDTDILYITDLKV